MFYYWEVNNHIEIWSLLENKMGIFLSSSSVCTIVWLHHLDFNELLGEIARQELHKDAVRYLEQILEAAPDKTATVRPFTSNLTKHPSDKTNKDIS